PENPLALISEHMYTITSFSKSTVSSIRKYPVTCSFEQIIVRSVYGPICRWPISPTQTRKVGAKWTEFTDFCHAMMHRNPVICRTLSIEGMAKCPNYAPPIGTPGIFDKTPNIAVNQDAE